MLFRSAGLCGHLGMSTKEFQDYVKHVLRYRDKFIAHLDEDRVMHIPRIRVARRSTAYLYEHLLREEEGKKVLWDAQQSAREFYSVMYRHAYGEYRRGT